MLTPQEMTIAEQRITGETLENIGKQNGLPLTTTHRKLSKPEVRAYLQKLQDALINKTLAKAVGNIHNVVSNYLKAPDDSRKCDHGFRASLRLMESAGLLPGQAQSIYIQQIYNDNRTEMPESIRALFAQVTHNDVQKAHTLLDDPGIIDAEGEAK